MLGLSRYNSLQGVNRAFTLVEMLVVISILGVLIGLLVPAVQATRETARAASCQNNLKNQALALLAFHEAHRYFPPGCVGMGKLHHSWATFILPHLEERALYQRVDFRKPWNDPAGNYEVAQTVLRIFRCPSSVLQFAGDTDYGGVCGSGLTGAQWRELLQNGTLIYVKDGWRGVSLAAVTDGASNTIMIAEGADRLEEDHGGWADGLNILSHDNGGVNLADGDIRSWHPGGSFAARVDGGVMFISVETDPWLIGALCTRDGEEVVALGE